jgi:hypothetical protein
MSTRWVHQVYLKRSFEQGHFDSSNWTARKLPRGGDSVMIFLDQVFYRSATVAFITLALSVVTPSQATTETKVAVDRELPVTMRQLYKAFKELQPLLYNQQRFLDSSNKSKIASHLEAMTAVLNTTPSLGHTKVKEPGFAAEFAGLQRSLQDASKAFGDGREQWALWRLRNVTNRCSTCHTSYKVAVTFVDPTLSEDVENPFVRGELFLASRQFERASKAFFQAAADPQNDEHRMEALRKWIIIQTRVSPHPHEAIKQLKAVISTGRLLPFEQEEVREWLASLTLWAEETASATPVSQLRKAENLLHQALILRNPADAQIGTVELLRATALLHQTLEQRELPSQEKRRALYLLGYAYSELPLFFVNELPEVYLEQCIREFPGSEDAKRAYRVYRELVLFEYTGSSGTHLPADMRAKLHELHNFSLGLIPQSNQG